MKLLDDTIRQARYALDEHSEHERLFRELDKAYNCTFRAFHLSPRTNVNLSKDEVMLILILLKKRKGKAALISTRDKDQDAIDDLQKFLI